MDFFSKNRLQLDNLYTYKYRAAHLIIVYFLSVSDNFKLLVVIVLHLNKNMGEKLTILRIRENKKNSGVSLNFSVDSNDQFIYVWNLRCGIIWSSN